MHGQVNRQKIDDRMEDQQLKCWQTKERFARIAGFNVQALYGLADGGKETLTAS
jgi:hypothetical protein